MENNLDLPTEQEPKQRKMRGKESNDILGLRGRSGQAQTGQKQQRKAVERVHGLSSFLYRAAFSGRETEGERLRFDWGLSLVLTFG